jgi:hypothetical protein
VRRRLFFVAIVVVALLAVLAPSAKRFISRAFPYHSALYAGLARNYAWSWSAPAGATTTEANPAYKAEASASVSSAADLSTAALLYRAPVTRIENADAPLSAAKEVHFCPGVSGGAEWNGPA